jgi:predicted nucleotidyltransferase
LALAQPWRGGQHVLFASWRQSMLLLRSCAGRRGPRHGLLLLCRAPCSSGCGGGGGGGHRGGRRQAAEAGTDSSTAGSLGSCGKSQLHRQILHFAETVHPTEREMRSRALAFKRTRDVVRSVLPGAHVSQFGSTSTGIALPGSDVDIVVIHRPGKRLADPSASLRKVLNAMRKSQLHDGRKAPLLIRAKVPILKFTEKRSGEAVDLSCNSVDGLRNSQAIRVAVRSRSELQPLLLVLKAFLKQRNLNETFNGGIGSYLLFAMVLRRVEPRAASPDVLEAAWELGRAEQLRSFLGPDGASAFMSEHPFHVSDDLLDRPLRFRDMLRGSASGARAAGIDGGAADETDVGYEVVGQVEAGGDEAGSKPSRLQGVRFPQAASAASEALSSAGSVAMRFLLGEAVDEFDNLTPLELKKICGASQRTPQGLSPSLQHPSPPLTDLNVSHRFECLPCIALLTVSTLRRAAPRLERRAGRDASAYSGGRQLAPRQGTHTDNAPSQCGVRASGYCGTDIGRSVCVVLGRRDDRRGRR